MTASPQLSQLAAEWRTARLLYPLYSALAREFVIELQPCSDLEAGVEAPPQESVAHARQWLAEMDGRIQVHQLRQFLQTTTMVGDEALRVLLIHHLRKARRTDSDRDKLDFLLVQYFSYAAPSRLEEGDVDLEYVAQVLEPVLGAVALAIPAWLSPLEELVQAANRSRTLNELLTSGLLDKGRKLKVSAAANYFLAVSMIAFTRFNFLMRRVFFRLMHEDLNAILDGLRDLEQKGISSLDCRRAQFSSDEPTVRLRMICQSWKVMFHAEYSSGQPLRMLVDLRAVVDAALARAARGTAKSAAPAAPRAQAAAVGAKSAARANDAPEFEVLSGTSDPGNDGQA
jgi:hypothetical protein